MKTNEILKAITGSDKANKETKNQMKTFEQVFALMKEIKNEVTSVEIGEGTFYLGSYVNRRSNGVKEFIFDKDKSLKAEKWTVKTGKGTYCQTIPTGNDFYFAFNALLSDFVPQVVTENRIADFAIHFTDKSQVAIIKAAAKFCSTDELRPAMMNVRIELKKEGLVNVIATDAHKLYFEQFFINNTFPEMEFLIPAKELTKVKSDLEIELFKDESGQFTTGKINGSKFNVCNDRYPDYINVWPQYENYIEVLKDDLVTSVKTILPFANKTTKQIRFYFNGAVFLSAEDLDFSNESGIKIGYLNKTTPDFEIGFNGKFLLECLAAMPENKVRIYSNGKANKAVIINDKALLMPVILNQYA